MVASNRRIEQNRSRRHPLTCFTQKIESCIFFSSHQSNAARSRVQSKVAIEVRVSQREDAWKKKLITVRDVAYCVRLLLKINEILVKGTGVYYIPPWSARL